MDDQHVGSSSRLDQLNLSIPDELPSPLYALEDISDVDLTYPGKVVQCIHLLIMY